MELNKEDVFRVSNASKGQFDIREDEEQYVKLVECLDMLISAGYFRAKIQGLNAFDKIVGGMVWCISLCAQQVDVDLLYSENSTIGQKIALTERIVEVLPKVKCPHTIEPHQIQGLDCIHIFPSYSG
uniref:Coiled-coil domain-containing protein 93 n=1 Tax=Ditylenchus dipsaci TaxID=166011 RepID=A0A915ERR8_9BILA